VARSKPTSANRERAASSTAARPVPGPGRRPRRGGTGFAGLTGLTGVPPRADPRDRRHLLLERRRDDVDACRDARFLEDRAHGGRVGVRDPDPGARQGHRQVLGAQGGERVRPADGVDLHGGGATDDVPHAPLGHDAAQVHEDQAVALLGLLHVVRADEQPDAGLRLLVDGVPESRAGDGVDTEVGSSRTSRSGPCDRAQAKASWRCCPSPMSLTRSPATEISPPSGAEAPP